MKIEKMTVKLLMASMLMAGMASLPSAYAEGNCCPPQTGSIHGKSVVSALLSGLIWPGIGQAVNDNGGKKVATHAVLGLLPPYRIWSAYDALVDRQGGYWNGKI